MKILLIVFVIIFLFLEFFKNYVSSNFARICKFEKSTYGIIVIGLLVIAEWILGSIIVIKIILKLIGE